MRQGYGVFQEYSQGLFSKDSGRGGRPFLASYKGSMTRLFSTVLRLIDTHYAESISQRAILDSALNRLSLTLLPQCMEGVEPIETCSAPADRCFFKAVKTISRNCGEKQRAILARALRYLLRDLDPNSGLLDSAMLKELKISTSGKFGGIGMVVTARDGDYVVISPFDGSPAYEAGIKPGDTIVEIDGKSLHGMPLLEVLQLVRGPAGSRMSLTVKDKTTGSVGRLRIRRQVIRVAPVRHTVLPDHIGYLRIVNFQKNTATQVEKALEEMFDFGSGGVRGLILDLRDNPGGLFTEAISVADLFLPSGVITSVRGSKVHSYTEFTAQQDGTFPEVPMVVLMNSGSASASEILAGALQGRPNVLVMGDKSFGKASVQGVFSLGRRTALRLTTAHYYTPDGRDIHGKGLEPDVMVDSPEGVTRARIGQSDERALDNDPEIAQAVKYLVGQDQPQISPFSTWY